MDRQHVSRLTAIPLGALAVVFLFIVVDWASATHSQSTQPSTTSEPFASGSLVEPNQLADVLTQSNGKAPVICVGDKVLYEGAHIPDALYLGPGRTTAGLDTLHKWAEDLPREKAIVIYCGCCPWGKCPNIRPAYSELKKMGFTNTRVLHLSQSFANDWVAKGFSANGTAIDQFQKKAN
jgi:thiosulfate/3-mercaptopyruvate sulfurtransferase